MIPRNIPSLNQPLDTINRDAHPPLKTHTPRSKSLSPSLSFFSHSGVRIRIELSLVPKSNWGIGKALVSFCFPFVVTLFILMELSSSYSCVHALVICLPYSSYANLVLCPYGYSYAKVLLCSRCSLYVFHIQSMFRLVDLCYGIGLMFLLIALVLKHVKSIPWGIRVLINNV